MNSWITRLARAGWWDPFRMTPWITGSARAEPARARSPSKCARAMPPRPPPKRQRNSRRVQLARCKNGVNISASIHEHEFVAVEEDAAQVGQPVCFRIGRQLAQFTGLGR